jgi:DNA adenine methylase
MLGPLSYIGGKRALAKQIIAIFPPHITYVEAFCGGGQVFFRKEPSKVEVINDLDRDVVNFFRVAQAHTEELIRTMRFMVASRSWFDLMLRINPDTMTDVQRAARYLYLTKNTYASLVRRRNYGTNVTQLPPFNPERLPEVLEETRRRLARVQIENLPYEDVLRRYDRPTTLFYLDPPYYDRTLYRYNLDHRDFVKMAERLRGLQGKFVLSLNDVPQVRTIFEPFKIRGVELHYTAQKVAGKRFKEVVITNF